MFIERQRKFQFHTKSIRFQALCKSEGEVKDKDDTLCDILASAAFDKYPSDFESMYYSSCASTSISMGSYSFISVLIHPDATDEDIGSILEEMSKIAGALSPNSGPECPKSGSNSKNNTGMLFSDVDDNRVFIDIPFFLIEEERSVEELLQEAEKLVKKTSSSISKSNSRSDTLVADNKDDQNESLLRVRQLEDDIFHMIQAEVHKESEKVRKSPKFEHKRDPSPGLEVVYENLNVLKPSKTLELQRRKFEEQKVEVSSSSDLDDPIERFSKTEDLKSTKEAEDKDNLQKEITDVDKDFFENLLKKSKEKSEGGMSGSSSFGQEDFSHFLRILQGQSDKKDQEAKTNDSNIKNKSGLGFQAKPDATTFEKSRIENELKSLNSPAFPEKEISEVLKRELPNNRNKYDSHEISESDSNSGRERSRSNKSLNKESSFSRNSSIEISKKSESRSKEMILSRNSSVDSSGSNGSKKDVNVVNSKNELYTVGLTPRLELFADAIPKLIAEKSNENLRKQEQKKLEKEKERELHGQTEETQKDNSGYDNKGDETYNNDRPQTADGATTGNGDRVGKVDIKRNVLDHQKTDRSPDALDNRNQKKKEIKFVKSKSYDQLPKSISNLKMSLDDVKGSKHAETSNEPAAPILKKSPVVRAKVNSKPVSKFTTKVKLSPKPKKDLPKSNTASSLNLNARKVDTKSVENIMKHNLAGGDMNRNLSKSDWETLCKEERHKNVLLKGINRRIRNDKNASIISAITCVSFFRTIGFRS